MSLIRRALGRGRSHSRMLTSFSGMTVGDDPWVIPTNGSLSVMTPSGIAVSQDSAMQLLAVYACVRLLAGVVSGLPMEAVSETGGIRKKLDPSPTIVADPFGGQAELA